METRPAALMVSWNGRGRPSAPSAIASPSTTADRAQSRRAAATAAGTPAVTSRRLRVKTRTASPSRWICTRMPSSLTSTAAAPVRPSASATDGADCASIGSTGWNTCNWNACNPSPPSRSAASATAGRSPDTMSARRTRSSGASAATAMASTRRPSRAPCRTSPIKSRSR